MKKKKLVCFFIILCLISILLGGCGKKQQENDKTVDSTPSMEGVNPSANEEFYLKSSGADNSFLFNIDNYKFKRVKLWVEYYEKGEKKKDYNLGEFAEESMEQLLVSVVEKSDKQIIDIYASCNSKNGTKRLGPITMETKPDKNYLKAIKAVDGKINIEDGKEVYLGFVCKNKEAVTFNEDSLKGEKKGEDELLRNEYAYIVKAIFYNE